MNRHRAPESGDLDPHPGDPISEIIAEFSEVFAFARTRWSHYAEEVHPDLRGVGVMVLQTILRKGPVTATGIGQMLDMDKSVVSRQVARLRDLELIVAEPAEDDRRVILLTPSDRAEKLLTEIRERNTIAYQERFAGWSPEELETLRAGLHRFNGTAPGLHADGPARRCAREHGGGAARSD
ncbi:MarR family winged helix-turn-helix transcriptional regulator [Leucobacter soli]|uniref:HTH marR-type domain-containing protein n=1 Tax=Leucobacter soli TaxID=2812850 RepID=A0A916NP50_9MICO|nr:MarR family transcriptional regulator [Leucobacter soli]CAG7617213.1 hypothetical protein LEUCIP111803_02077 [Leucobacter soli]